MEIDLLEAYKRLRSGDVVAVPTETVYGLAASLDQNEAIDQIFQLKGRPSNNPLIIHVSDFQEIIPFLLDAKQDFIELATEFWPGPMTLVLLINEEKVPSRVRAGLKTAAFRVPNHPIARDLLKLTGPLVMPSANLSGRPSATSKEHVEMDFGLKFPVLQGGECSKGLESTILYQDPFTLKYQIIRQGAIPQEAFLDLLGYLPEIIYPNKSKEPICPGQMYRHYAPKAHLHLVNEFHEDDFGAFIGFEERSYPNKGPFYSLGSMNDPEEISRNLYRILRKLDLDDIKEAYVDINLPNFGLYLTILERLKKASSKS